MGGGWLSHLDSPVSLLLGAFGRTATKGANVAPEPFTLEH
jgi:hypothetical protein